MSGRIAARYPWFDWKSPDYAPVWRDRMAKLEALRKEPERWEQLKKFYANPDHIADFIIDWGVTFDPRNAAPRPDGTRVPTTMPFLLFPKQEDFIEFVRKCWEERNDGVVEKSRDMGVSWLCVAIAVWMWLFEPGSIVGFGSRKEDLVDKIGDPDSLFWKIRTFIALLPVEFRPEGYDERKHAVFMRIINPANEAVIRGEGGDNIGRGGRATLYFKDEAQPLSARILTPTGWSTMGDMRVGSRVIGADGKARTVTHVNDAGEHPVYRIGFSDGTSTKASPNHLWRVGRRTLRTHELAERFRYEAPCGQVRYRLRVPVTKPVEFDPAPPLPVDAYVLGCLLGDGCMRGSTPRLTTADTELAAEVEALLPEGVSMTRDREIGYRLVSSVGGPAGRFGPRNEMRALLERVGTYGSLAHGKRVPTGYLLAATEDRLALLQGLMDTDGSASGGVASFHTASAGLAEDVRFLVQSLGGTATHNVKPDARGYRDMHVLHLCLPMQLFRLKRKLKALKPRKHPPGRTITSVELLPAVPVRCITVDAPDGLYLTDHCIVTHNSAHYEHAEAIDAALSMTANTQIDVSTPNGEGNPFWQKRFSGVFPVFVFDWRDDPRKGKLWYEVQRQRKSKVALAQEVDRDYSASVSNSYIESTIVTQAMHRGPADIPPGGGLRVGLDVARFGDDKCVLTFRRGRVVLKQVKWSKSSIPGTYGRAKQEIKRYKILPEQIAVDVIGLGAGVFDLLAADPDFFDADRETVCVEVNSALIVDNGEDYNLRAFMWRQMKDWLPTASIPNDPDLRISLTGIRYGYRGGALLMESKDDMKRRGLKSPDEGDSLALTFAFPAKKRKPPPVPMDRIAVYTNDEIMGM